MLSYRHAFHAGNHADVIKHLTLILTLDYYTQKDKPFTYIDTHAGSGVYQLYNQQAQHTREFESGIQTLWQAPSPPAAVQRYIDLVRYLNPTPTLQHYPGSPWLAAQCLRPTDSLRLFELHPNDYKTLAQFFTNNKRVQVRQQDGLEGLIAQLPPVTRRAVILIDPSYELKTDYAAVISTLTKAHKRFATGTYLLWYPVISRQRVKQMEKALQQTGIPNTVQIEFCPSADKEGLGMTGSGLFVINPPWQLEQQTREILPWLSRHMADNRGQFGVKRISPE